MVTSGETFLYNADALANLIKHRLYLFKGEYLLDINEGTDYRGKILGKKEEFARESEIKRVIIETPKVEEMTHFDVTRNLTKRTMHVSCGVLSELGLIEIDEDF